MRRAATALILLTCGALGYLAGSTFFHDPLSLAYLTLAGALFGLLVDFRWGARLADRLHALLDQPPDVYLAAGLGVLIALLAGVLLTNLLSQIPGFAWYHSLFLTLLLALGFGWIAVKSRRLFIQEMPASRRRGGTLLDTSVLIDGRVADVVRLGFLDDALFVPDFVLRELQGLADSPDPASRAKGRRGLKTLAALRDHGLEVLATGIGGEVDDALLALAQREGMRILTNDSALLDLAKIYGLKGLSIHALAAALKAPYQPGETLRVRIEKKGKEPGQGVGYLEDGTMVVVENAEARRGSWVEATVTQVIQTPLGKMVFARSKSR